MCVCVCMYVYMCVCVVVCVSISGIRCNNTPVHTQWVGTKDRMRKKERKLFMKVVPKGNNLVARTAMYTVPLNVHKNPRLIIMSSVSHKFTSLIDRHILSSRGGSVLGCDAVSLDC